MQQATKEGCGGQTNRVILNYLDQKFAPTIENCPGCLYNCYIMEETLGLSQKNLKSFLLSLVFMLLEIPTVIQMAKITARRNK